MLMCIAFSIDTNSYIKKALEEEQIYGEPHINTYIFMKKKNKIKVGERRETKLLRSIFCLL